MALDASVIGFHIVHARGIENIAARGMGDVPAAMTVATCATDVPLDDLFGVNVVVEGVAGITGRGGGALHVVGRIKGFPPVRSFGYKVGTPNAVGNVPLRGFWKIVIADFCEVALLPDSPVDELHLVLRKFSEGICGEIGNYGLGMLAGFADHVGHARLLQSIVDLLVGFLASL